MNDSPTNVDHQGKSDSIAFEERMERIEEGIMMFHQYLEQAPSIVLPSNFRLAVAWEARSCLSCPGCATVTVNCGQHRMSPHSLMESRDHDTSGEVPYSITDRSSWESVQHLVHFVINNPSAADKRWYKQTLQSLKHTSLCPPFSPQVASLFAEIVATAITSHMIHTTYVSMGQTPPKLPALMDENGEEMLSSLPFVRPTLEDPMTSGLAGKGPFRQETRVAWSPFLLAKDLDTQSAIFRKLPWQVQLYLQENLVESNPLIGLSAAPLAMALCGRVIARIGLPEQHEFLLANNTHYPCEEPRSDWELVAQSVNERLNSTAAGLSVEKKRHHSHSTSNDRELQLTTIGQQTSPKRRNTLLTMMGQQMSQKQRQKLVRHIHSKLGESTLLEAATAVAWSESLNKIRAVTGNPSVRGPSAPHSAMARATARVVPVLRSFFPATA